MSTTPIMCPGVSRKPGWEYVERRLPSRPPANPALQAGVKTAWPIPACRAWKFRVTSYITDCTGERLSWTKEPLWILLVNARSLQAAVESQISALVSTADNSMPER